MSLSFNVVIPCAGKGTRLSPLTLACPKELLPVPASLGYFHPDERPTAPLVPAVHLAISEARASIRFYQKFYCDVRSGVTAAITLVVSAEKLGTFQRLFAGVDDIRIVQQPPEIQDNLLQAIRCGTVGTEHLVGVILPDELWEAHDGCPLRAMVATSARSHHPSAAEAQVFVERPSRREDLATYGVFYMCGYKLWFEEKPEGGWLTQLSSYSRSTSFIARGRYLFSYTALNLQNTHHLCDLIGASTPLMICTREAFDSAQESLEPDDIPTSLYSPWHKHQLNLDGVMRDMGDIQKYAAILGKQS